MTLGRRLLFLTIIAGCLLAIAAPAEAKGPAGANLTGCSGGATSLTAGGDRISVVRVPGAPPASSSQPFVVTTDGTVAYRGQSDTVITDHSWKVALYGVPVKTGGSPNEDEETTAEGVVQISEYLPIDAVGLFYVSGDISGTGTPCVGSIWVKVDGSPTGTLPWIAGIGLTVVGLVGVLGARPKAIPTPSTPPPTERAGLGGPE